jgi:anti-sigma28 factor (negative regulator of flagellin synthesis)
MFKRKRDHSPGSKTKHRKTSANLASYLETLKISAQTKIAEVSVTRVLDLIEQLSADIAFGEITIENSRIMISQQTTDTSGSTSIKQILNHFIKLHSVFSKWSSQLVKIDHEQLQNLQSILETEDAHWMIETLKNLIFLKNCTFKGYKKVNMKYKRFTTNRLPNQ